MKKLQIAVIALTVLLSSCVTQKKYKGLQSEYDKLKTSESALNSSVQDLTLKLANCRTESNGLNDKIKMLQENVALLQKLIDDCQKQNNQGGVNISKLVDEINVANKYIKELVATNQRNDSLNMVLSNNLKRSLSDVASDDVQIKVQKGVVFISLSDKMLYNSGKYTLNTAAAGTLDKIAKILNDYKDYDVLVQGNTDNVPIATATIADNWDLSCLRATSVARYLQNNLNINPSRITAGGRSEYQPKVSNDTPANRSINRRTEIIVMPKLDEFMKLLEAGKK
ncbi:MAG: OmpA family protein [Chitinophagales bacterium]|jgi:chemotaxis protein MotB|nr:OmpA family protein [Chitinophagales bacterium]